MTNSAFDFVDYSIDASKSAEYPSSSTYEAINYLTHLLASEAGEVSGKFQKLIRDTDPHEALKDPEVVEPLADECGDCLWALSEIARHLYGCYGLEVIARRNIEKLQGRMERGTIKGSGDKR